MELKKGDDSDYSLDNVIEQNEDIQIVEECDEGDLIDSDRSNPLALSSKPTSYQKKSKNSVEIVSKQIQCSPKNNSPRSQTVFNYKDFQNTASPFIVEQKGVATTE